jgi:hypothetical protein
MAQVLTDLKAERYVDTSNPDGKNRLCVDAYMEGDIQIGAIEIKDADTNDRANVLLRDDGKYALAVDMAGDIQIGAIEIKDHNSDARADVQDDISLANINTYNGLVTKSQLYALNENSQLQHVESALVQGKNAIVVTQAEQTTKSYVTVYDDTNIVSGNEDVLLTYTVPVGKVYHITAITVGGLTNGRFTLEVDGKKKARGRNSAATPTVNLDCQVITALAGDIIEIKCLNDGKVTKPFEAGMFGYLLDN